MAMIMQMLPDEVVAECARQQTNEARAVLLGRYAEAIYDVVYNLSGGSREAEDLTYETLISACGEGWSKELNPNFRTWLFGAAIEKAMVAGRRRPVALFDVGHLAGRLRDTLEGLDGDTRAAFVLCDLAELPTEEAAAILQRPPRDIRQRVHGARLAMIARVSSNHVEGDN